MTILENISSQLKDAMRAKDATRLQVLRSIKEELLKLQTSGTDVQPNKDNLTKIVKTLIKEKKESIQLAQQAKRSDIIEQEQTSLDILQTFLPEQLSQQEITTLIQTAIKDSSANGIQDMGKVMGQTRQLLQASGKDADMNIVSKIVKEQLNA